MGDRMPDGRKWPAWMNGRRDDYVLPPRCGGAKCKRLIEFEVVNGNKVDKLCRCGYIPQPKVPRK